jgi:cytochrome c556
MMVWYLEPAADVIWDSAGFVITEDGEVDLQPTTQEGWDQVRNSATVVAEGGNLLMLPGLAVDADDWRDYSSGLIDAGVKARQAAVNRDAEALFDAGGQIYNVCRACHNRYMDQSGG